MLDVRGAVGAGHAVCQLTTAAELEADSGTAAGLAHNQRQRRPGVMRSSSVRHTEPFDWLGFIVLASTIAVIIFGCAFLEGPR